MVSRPSGIKVLIITPIRADANLLANALLEQPDINLENIVLSPYLPDMSTDINRFSITLMFEENTRKIVSSYVGDAHVVFIDIYALRFNNVFSFIEYVYENLPSIYQSVYVKCEEAEELVRFNLAAGRDIQSELGTAINVLAKELRDDSFQKFTDGVIADFRRKLPLQDDKASPNTREGSSEMEQPPGAPDTRRSPRVRLPHNIVENVEKDVAAPSTGQLVNLPLEAVDALTEIMKCRGGSDIGDALLLAIADELLIARELDAESKILVEKRDKDIYQLVFE